MSFPLLTAVAVVPALGAIATAALPAAKRTAAKWLALLFSLGTFALALVVAFRFDPGAKGPFQLTESHAWISDFGVRYELGVDGIAVALIALTTLLIPFIILAGWHDADPWRQRPTVAPPRARPAATAGGPPRASSRWSWPSRRWWCSPSRPPTSSSSTSSSKPC